jgi:hypothetical protein
MPNITPNSPVPQNSVFFSIASSATFRDLLIAKNLPPYNIEGVYSYQGVTDPYQIKLSDNVPTDTPNVSEIGEDEASQEMILNKYGPGTKILDGADILASDGTVSYSQAGQGSVFGGSVESKKEYDQSSANIQLVNEFFIDLNAVINRYIPEDGYNYSYITTETIVPKGAQGGAPYPNFDMPDFGFFNGLQGGAFSLFNLESSNPFSQDSYMAQLSTTFLANAFRVRVNREIEKATTGRVNLQAFSDVYSASLLASGQQDLIAKNYVITVPSGLADQASFLLQKFSGTYLPTSPIEGDYFEFPPRRNTTLGQLIQSGVNRITKPVTPTNRSERFLANTGSGQKIVLFTNLGFNIYKPNYDENLTQIGTLIYQIFDKDNSIGNLYVGQTDDIPALFAPSGEVPYTPYGDETRTKVYGDDVLSKQFETDDINRRKFGLSSLPYGEDGDPAGGFTWKSLQGPQPGTLVGPGTNTQPTGEVLGTSPVYTGNVRDKLQSSLSTNFEYNETSLLARTQRIVESADLVKGAKRLTHAGNAINQISKIFNDGYKEITKGSRVRKYVNKNGIEVGQEYGRVFTKDTPYLTYQNLQSGVANDGGEPINGNIRKFTYSVIDSTYNLNIAPMAGKESTNIQKTGLGNVKKYMLSIENLAWKGTAEFNNLPLCEQGPNGGRIMWFPPYALTLDSDSSRPIFNATNFLGRPEPIYTYQNTERSTGLSFKIIVDHPSVANLIVKRELSKTNYSDNDVREIMASFFAGLKKYDIYELARKYNTLSPETINEAYTQVLENNRSSTEDIAQVQQNIGPTSNTVPVSNQVQSDLSQYVNYSFYFENNTTDENYEDVYVAYRQPSNIENYINSQPDGDIAFIEVFFDSVLFSNYERLLSLRDSITQILTTKQGKVEITFGGSKMTTQNSNITVSNSWYESMKKFFTEYQTGEGNNLGIYLGKTLIFKKSSDFGTRGSVEPKSNTPSNESFPCVYSQGSNSYSFNSTVCRAVIIDNIVFTPQDPTKDSGDETQEIDQTGTKDKTPVDLQSKFRGISKKILRELLTECNYFEAIKNTDSFLYESIKSKFKFFNPAFHSITPEGLNSRLVFLNQCVRPGRTISNTGDSTEPSSAFNTNFGTPPVLVLRVGDFYHTKIIPESLSISYEENSWDMNPEGIGFQPMIATVGLTFKMIGGHGLAEPIEKLQNALSFNYYANTEMYDERADATESTEAIDKAIVESINNAEPLPNVVNVNNVDDFGSPFGVILSASTAVGDTPATAVQDGEIEYTELFNNFVEKVKNYMSKTTTNFVSFINEFNYGVWSQVNHIRIYNVGYVNAYFSLDNQTEILGKQTNYQTYLVNTANLLITAIDTYEDRLAFLLNESELITNQTRNKILSNYKNIIINEVSTGFTRVSEFIQGTSESQLDLVKSMNVMDFISISGDGKTLPDGNPKIYSLSGKTDGGGNTLDEFVTDYVTVVSGITDYYEYGSSGGTDNEGFLFITNALTTGNITTYKSLYYDGWEPVISDGYVYTLLSKILLNPTLKEGFINDLVKDVNEDYKAFAKDFVTVQVDEGWVGQFTNERKKELELIAEFENSPNYQQFKNFNPTRDGVQLTSKKRVMQFKTGQGDSYLQALFRDITSSSNYNDSLVVFNGKKQFNG